MVKSDSLIGGIEAGGTKFVCAIGHPPNDIQALERFPTTTPEETLGRTLDFFQNQPRLPDSIGIATFGPADVHPDSETYGYITSTPKPGWSNTDLGGVISRELQLPIVFDTDVNGAAVGEYLWGNGQGTKNLLYLTIGTGIGGGALVNGKPIHGLVHPEMGHLFLPRAEGDDYEGYCPFHGTCLEGMACGPAIEDRWGIPAKSMPPDHIGWSFEAHYISLALVNLILTLSPERIILGGGVMQQMHLFPSIRSRVVSHLNGYVQASELTYEIDQYIIPPGLGSKAGVLGAMGLTIQFL
ncbi:MAG: ROK family protein [Bacteroidetes bacterium]|nr:ROK family protein [Bacteroidota bacterium]MCY4204710.1 ROK family protein [Bacteroidota bacterium]